MRDRILGAISGAAVGITSALCAAITACVLVGIIFAKLDPRCAHLASGEVFIRIALSGPVIGLVCGALGGLGPVSRVMLAGPFSLFFGTLGLVAGPFIGLLVRLAFLSVWPQYAPAGNWIEHDVRWGALIGAAFGALQGVRFFFHPPLWWPGAE